MEQSLQKKEPDYDEEVTRCFESLNFAKTFCPSRAHERQLYYVDLKDALNDRISLIKRALIAKIHTHRDSKKQKGKNLES